MASAPGKSPQREAENLPPIKHDVRGEQHLIARSSLKQKLVLIDNEAVHVAREQAVQLMERCGCLGCLMRLALLNS